jgi:hypothetical protein
MEITARLFNCARCRCQVAICSRCDRGNIYCSPRCSQRARRESQRAAGRRYQNTFQGRLAHAERQRRYRARRQEVTHQGSPAAASDDSLSGDSEESAGRARPTAVDQGADIRCCLCGCRCSAYVRWDFLRRRPPSGSKPIPDTHPPPWPARSRLGA